MKRLIIIQLCIILFLSTSLAQQKVRGVSPPGRIGQKKKKVIIPVKPSDIECILSFNDPSGDNTISEGEEGTVTVLVKNKSLYFSIKPKLEISVKASWDPKPRTITKWMDIVEPEQTETYKLNVKWDEKLPSGTITYKAKVTDIISQLTSEPAELSFNIIGRSKMAEPSLFVDVDSKIPIVPLQNNYAIAVVIGNRDYSNPDVPDVEYAVNDAVTVKKYLLNVLGFREENIIFIENATKADFERIFGTKDVYQGKLYNWTKPNQSDVFIYYSGHGAPDVINKKAYFMPCNSDPNYVRIDGYPLEVFYRNIEKIPAKSITIVLDACFSGASQEGMLIKNASPMYIDVETPLLGEDFNLFASASGDQIASWYPKGNHSLFTYYFLRALRGEADKDRDRKITLKEIENFLEDNVSYMARRLYGREQTPVVKGASDAVISTY